MARNDLVGDVLIPLRRLVSRHPRAGIVPPSDRTFGWMFGGTARRSPSRGIRLRPRE